MTNIDYLTASNVAILLLSILGGFAVSFLFTGKGIRGCLMQIISATILVVIIVALIKGYSTFLENITQHLTEYIYYNSLGIFGFILGFILGFIRKNK